MAAYPYALLTPDDLVDFTGYQKPGKQSTWLRQHGIRFCVRADGSVALTWGAVDAALAPGGQDARNGPNLSAMPGMG